MGMPCQVNSIVKLNGTEFPSLLAIDSIHTARKSGYRIFPIDVPLQLVDDAWCAHADVVITQLTWTEQQTVLNFLIHRIYDQPWALK
jgi:Protein of unknown function (DUF2584)